MSLWTGVVSMAHEVERMGELVWIRLPFTTPSMNNLGARGNPRHWHRKKKRLQEQIEQWLMYASLPRPLPNHVRVEVDMLFPTQRRRDEGNYQPMIEKAVGDALVNGGWMLDDTPEHWTFGRVSFGKGAAQTVILIDYRAEV